VGFEVANGSTSCRAIGVILGVFDQEHTKEIPHRWPCPSLSCPSWLDAFRAGEGVDLIRDAVRIVLQELIEVEATEEIGAGQSDDCGDLVTRNGALVVQVRNWRDVGRACFDGADAAERQALAHPAAALGVALVRRRGGRWAVTMTPDTLAWLLHTARVVTVVRDA
jgi:hypothetical protein